MTLVYVLILGINCTGIACTEIQQTAFTTLQECMEIEKTIHFSAGAGKYNNYYYCRPQIVKEE